jgi:hypothetical protein
MIMIKGICIDFFRWVFAPKLNLFDILFMVLITPLVLQISYWFILLLIPSSIFSVYFQNKLGGYYD